MNQEEIQSVLSDASTVENVPKKRGRPATGRTRTKEQDNARKRNEYANNPEYRERRKAHARERYHAKKAA